MKLNQLNANRSLLSKAFVYDRKTLKLNIKEYML